jgi:hypothetical protein
LASADWVMAARCKLPSGFLTILMGLTSPSEAADCPVRNGAEWKGHRQRALDSDRSMTYPQGDCSCSGRFIDNKRSTAIRA